ncbi:MAG: Fic family protein [Deltaproteobacteria bacterium]
MTIKREAFRDIDDRTEDLLELAASHPDIWQGFLRELELSWIYHENALEGIVLTHAELTSALKGRPIAPETYHDIRNERLAVSLVRREAAEGGKVDMALVRRIHATLGSHDPDFQPARYRKDIPLHRAYFHDIAQPQVIPSRVQKLFDWAIENDPEDDDAVRFAAHLHHEYMSIFPFSHHTGKTGRLLVNYVLIRHGYMPVVFHATERQRYYDTLRLSKKHMEQLLIDMMANCIENGTMYIEKELAERERIATRNRLALVK